MARSTFRKTPPTDRPFAIPLADALAVVGAIAIVGTGIAVLAILAGIIH